MSSTPATFSTLPAELRLMIYRHYFTVPGGYVLDHESQKLRAADGQKIHMDLMFTCRQVAREAQCLPLSLNQITISTADLQIDSNIPEMNFEYLLDELQIRETDDLVNARALLTPDLCKNVAQKYPDFDRIIKLFNEPTEDDGDEEGEVLSDKDKNILKYLVNDDTGITRWTNHAAITYALRLLVNQDGKNYMEKLNASKWHRQDHDPIGILNLCHEPWAIPPQDQVNAMAKALHDAWISDGYDEVLRESQGEKSALSAAAVAINWLQSVPADARAYIRSIVLNEDRESVAWPECHGMGLIPFCQENPDLRVERRVNLWKTAFQEFSIENWEHARSNDSMMELFAGGVSSRLAQWLVEAEALEPAGMPSGSFSVLLDGSPAPKICTQIFQNVVHRDVAWQLASQECRAAQNSIPAPAFYEQSGWFFISENLPMAIEHLVKGSALIRCNFNPGKPWNIDEMVSARSTWDENEWIMENNSCPWEEILVSHDNAELPALINGNFIKEEEEEISIGADSTL